MNRRIAVCSLAVAAALAGLAPLDAAAAPTVAFKTPLSGATISGNIYQSSACEVTGTNIRQVRFFLNNTALNTEGTAPWNCNIDTRNFTDGSHTLRAIAYDAAGASASTSRSVTIRNSTGSTGPSVSWRTPAAGATLTGVINLGSACEVTGSGFNRVIFHMDSTQLNTELTAPWQCTVDTRRFSNGTHTLRAVAYSSTGASTSITQSVNIANGTTTPTTPTSPANVAPTVSITSPAAGATLSGTAACAAAASDSDGTVASVQFLLGTSTISTDTAAPYSCAIDTTKFANGTYTLVARATDNAGAVTTAQQSVTVQNAVATPTPTPTPTPAPTPTPSLPSTNTKAVTTFESVGLHWKPGSNPGSAGCAVQYRKVGESTWRDGLAMWYDARNSECRGSIVHLTSGTDYEARFALPGQQPVAAVTFKTWSDNFPIARTIQVQNSSQMLNITEGGTKDGYVLYTGPATIDVANGADHNVRISAPYVIVRGLTMKGARVDAVKMFQGAHDVVIEDNDISGWGRFSGRYSSDGWQIGENADSGIKAMCNSAGPWLERTVIQRNKIHDPRYGSNSWSDGHPYGPNAIAYYECGGNHVFRHNEIWSSWSKYFMDAIGGGDNFSTKGFPNSDTDIYGNKIQHAWDDAIESEGANTNVRIWGNYIDQTATAVASTSTSVGPLYVFRNVQNRARNLSMKPLDSDQRLYAFKTGNSSSGDGRRYFFHNTLLQAPPPSGTVNPLGAGQGLSAPGGGQILTNTVSRNNIYHIWKSNWPSVASLGGSGNDLDHDMVNGTVAAYSGAEPNRITGTPKYAPGHGWSAEGTGNYQLAPDSPGYKRAVRIPNFNDAFTGTAPDFGAHESGTPPMKLGVQR